MKSNEADIYRFRSRMTGVAGLVYTLRRRDGLAFRFIKSVVHHRSVVQPDLVGQIFLVTESVLHPILVVSLGEIFSRVRSSALLSCLGRVHCLRCIRQKITELE